MEALSLSKIAQLGILFKEIVTKLSKLKIKNGKIVKNRSTTLGAASGAIAGLTTITPAAGFVSQCCSNYRYPGRLYLLLGGHGQKQIRL